MFDDAKKAWQLWTVYSEVKHMDTKAIINLVLSALAAGLGGVAVLYPQTQDTKLLASAFASTAFAAILQHLRTPPAAAPAA